MNYDPGSPPGDADGRDEPSDDRHRLPGAAAPRTRASERSRRESEPTHHDDYRHHDDRHDDQCEGHRGGLLFGDHDDQHGVHDDEHGGHDGGRFDDDGYLRTEPHRRRRTWIPILLAVALVLGGGWVAVKQLGLSLPSIGGGDDGGGDFAGEGEGRTTVRIEPGSSGMDMGQALEESGVVKSGRTFARVFGADPNASRIQPGTYTLRKEMSAASALKLMMQPGSRVGAGVTIPEGLWATEIFRKLSKATDVPVAEYQKVKASSLGLPAGADGRLEGYLFPSTYEFRKGTSAQDQLQAMVRRFKQQVQPLQVRADQLPRVVTLASIVQAEAAPGPDAPKVARVVENRIKPGSETQGRLEMDSTVHYLLQKRGTITTSDKDRRSTSPFNTYVQKGLPPGPINNPGIAAIKAAMNPTPGSWLYFVTVDLDTGKTLFSSNLKGHQKNVATFRSWCKAHPGRC